MDITIVTYSVLRYLDRLNNSRMLSTLRVRKKKLLASRGIYY